MDPKDPLCTFKVTHVQLLDNYGFLKIKKIYDGLDCNLINADNDGQKKLFVSDLFV